MSLHVQWLWLLIWALNFRMLQLHQGTFPECFLSLTDTNADVHRVKQTPL